MSPSTFFSALPVALATRLPIELRAFEHRRGFGRLMKFDYGRPGVHYEAWQHTATGRMEVGLHLEGTAAANEAGFRLLRGRLDGLVVDEESGVRGYVITSNESFLARPASRR